MKTAICKNCSKEFEYKYKDRSNSCSKECTKALISKSKIKYSKEQLDLVLELKRQKKTIEEIMSLSGVKRSKIKEVCKELGVLLSPEERQANAYKSKLEKNPNALNEMRAKITKDSYRRASESKKETFSDPRYREFFSENAKKIWEYLKSDKEIYDEYIKKRSLSSSEAKLGMTEEEYSKILLKIKEEVENNKETITSASIKMGVSPVTVLRRFHDNGWSNLLSLHVSKGQLDVYNFIKDNYNGEVLLNDKTGLKYTELDVYVPDLKFGIEYNGLYWHSSAKKDYKKREHYNKKKKCDKENIDLLAIFEDEWKDDKKRELIKNMILYRLKSLKPKTLHLRNLELIKLNKNDEFKDFFNNFHLDGHSKSSFAYGFFYNGELVFCASFRKNFNKELEISRLASNTNFSVPGALNKILKTINKPVVSFSNNRLSRGAIYINNGFKEITETFEPSYWYTDLHTRIWRFNCKKINDPEITKLYDSEESQALNGVFSIKLFGDNRPLYRIEDYGHRKWLWEPPK